MIKRIIFILAVIIATGCANMDLITTETNAMQSVTAARRLSIDMLNSGKITVDQEKRNKFYLDTLAASIKAAVAANNPAQVAANGNAAKTFDPVKGQ